MISFDDFIFSFELMEAIEDSNNEKVARLISKGLYIIESGYTFRAALRVAVEKQNLEVLDLLLRQDVINLDDPRTKGLTLLMIACQNRDADLDFIKALLLQYGFAESINAKSFFRSKTALHYAVKVCKLEIIKLLIENGADINEIDNKRKTALHIAIKRDDIKIVTHLLQNKADTTISKLPIVEATSNEMKEILVPYTNLCNEHALWTISGNIETMQLLWPMYQHKDVLAQWILENPKCIKPFFDAFGPLDFGQWSQLLRELFNDVTYDPNFSASLLEQLPFKISSCNEYSSIVQMLRLLLSKSKCLCSKILSNIQDSIIVSKSKYDLNYNYLLIVQNRQAWQQFIEFAPAIIRVLEDCNVFIKADICKERLVFKEKCWPLLWRMYCTPRKSFKKEILECGETEKKFRIIRNMQPGSKYFENYNRKQLCIVKMDAIYYIRALQKVRRYFATDNKMPSLVELCRNKIREEVFIKNCSNETVVKTTKPFHYATLLKTLPVPPGHLDILLLRQVIYYGHSEM